MNSRLRPRMQARHVLRLILFTTMYPWEQRWELERLWRLEDPRGSEAQPG